MIQLLKPLTIALKGKGSIGLAKRLWSIGQRYGLTAARMDRSLTELSRVIRRFDCRATLAVTAAALVRNSANVRGLQAQGIELAIHGYRHIDYSQLTLEEQLTHLRRASRIFRDLGIRVGGFRCPYLRWNDETLTALSHTRFVYDSSPSVAWNVTDGHMTESYQQALSFYGAQTAADHPALPYLESRTGLVRIPYCLPDDEALIERLQWHSLAEMNQIWPTIFHQIHQCGELFTLGLHPERSQICSAALSATLQEVRAAAPMVWCARLDEIAAWWKARLTAVVDISEIQDGVFRLIMSAPEGTTLLLRALDVKTAAEPWFDGYQRASERPCVIHSNKRPFIGVSPGTTSTLISFLKQQGYILEISSHPAAYSFYLDRGSFSCNEERRLLTEIEGAHYPLVRFGRWPNGTRSAMAVTGDIDALTVWDYGLRFLGR